MFIPFKELKAKQNMKKVKDNSIGMGLACSRSIIRELGGDVFLKESQKGKTIFKVTLQVEVTNEHSLHLEEISQRE